MGKILEFLATGFFIGKIGYFGGTIGSLLALPLIFFVRENVQFAVVFLILLTLGVISADFVEKKRGEKDPKEVVIDEVIGFFVSTFNLEPKFKEILLAFVIFRFFDILKPFPIRKVEKLRGGFAIVLDDVIAGIYTALVLFFIKRIF